MMSVFMVWIGLSESEICANSESTKISPAVFVNLYVTYGFFYLQLNKNIKERKTC